MSIISQTVRNLFEYTPAPPRVATRLGHYLLWFPEILPGGIRAIYVPSDEASPDRQEIQLKTYRGKIFMMGFVKRISDLPLELRGEERNGRAGAAANAPDLVAAGMAMNNDFQEQLGEWLFFLADDKISFYAGSTLEDGEYYLEATFDPIEQAQGVKDYIANKLETIAAAEATWPPHLREL